MTTLSDEFIHLKSLTTLNAKKNQFTAAGLKPLAVVLTANRLQHVNLKDNEKVKLIKSELPEELLPYVHLLEGVDLDK